MSETIVPRSADDFDKGLAALHKAAETSRTYFSTYLVTYTAVFLFALSAFIVPVEQDRISDMANDLKSSITCVFAAEMNDKSACQKPNNNIVASPEFLVSTAIQIQPIGGERKVDAERRFLETIQKIDAEIFQHRLNTMLDLSTDAARFTVPIVGIKIDNFWFAYFNIVAGLFFLYILLQAFENQLTLVQEVSGKTSNNLQRKMLNSAHIFASSGRLPKGHFDIPDKSSNVLLRLGGGKKINATLTSQKVWDRSKKGFMHFATRDLFIGWLLFLPVTVALMSEYSLLSILFPRTLPNISFLLAVLGSIIDGIAIPQWNPSEPSPVKAAFVLSCTAAFNAIIIVAMFGLFLRLCRVVGALMAYDADNLAKIDSFEGKAVAAK